MSEPIILGKYEIIKELGRGGFGIVYKAFDTILKRQVALKVLHPTLTVDPLFQKRFQREAELAAQMNHPNIVPIHDFDQRDGRTFIVMALMSGGSLKEQIESYGAMDHNHVKTILEQVASGLAYAHERDVIHRDLKPGNILLDDKGVARISDFGFARAISADSMSMSMGGGMLGTPSYMAPEIWEGKPPVPASDIYSLGCIAHEMLSGEQLFQGETPVQIMHDHIVRGPVPIEGIAPAWQSFLDRCLQANPADRYSSANAVLEDLKWGLFDAPVKQRETEIVIGGLEDNQDAIAGEQTTYQSEIGPLKDAEYSSSPTVPLTYHPYTGEAQYTMGQKLEFEAANLEPVYSEGQLLEFEAEKARKKRWILPTILVMLSVLFISILLLFSNIVKQKKEVSNASNMTTHSLNEARVLHENDTTSLVASTASAISTNQTLNAEPTEEIVLTPKTDEASEKPVFTSVLTRQIDGMEMVYIPAGSFNMGSVDEDADPDEKPERWVTLDDYWIDKYEVSNAQYQKCVKAKECDEPLELNSESRIGYYNDPQYENYPVVFVNWYQANSYCKWVGGGLPTEAQWEFAARGNGGRKYPWGNQSADCSTANIRGCGNDTGPVDGQEDGESPHKVRNMAGNVWEWVNDWWAESYDPADTNNPRGPKDGVMRALRGGSWASSTWGVRTTVRRGEDAKYSTSAYGFRCAMTNSQVSELEFIEDQANLLDTQIIDPTDPEYGTFMRQNLDGMEMVFVPEGKFTMGSDDDDSDKNPEREVNLGAFWMDKFEVSNKQYEMCVKAGSCTEPSSTESSTRKDTHAYYGNPKYDNFPVIYVTWEQANHYCQWVGGSLPTEEQWEKAARGESGLKYPWGNDDPTCDYANYWHPGGGCGGDTTAVDDYADVYSPYGAVNLAGNVWEWVLSDYGSYKGRRGGSWGSGVDQIQSASIFSDKPDNANDVTGFRCVLPMP